MSKYITERISLLLSRMKNIPYLPKWIIFIIDMLIVSVSFSLSYLVCFALFKEPYILSVFLIKLLLCLVITGLSLIAFKTYTAIIRYSGFRDILRIFYSLFCANILLFVVSISIKFINPDFALFPIEYLINFISTFSFVFLFRMVIRLMFDYLGQIDIRWKKRKNILIYGVSSSSIGMVELINRSPELEYKVIGFISTKGESISKKINSYPVYNIEEIFVKEEIRRLYNAILINPKEIERTDKIEITERAVEYKKEMLISPQIADFNERKEAKVKKLRKIKIEDLLQRIPIEIDIESIGKNFSGKIILVTGAAGSIGSEIVRQIGRFDCKQLLAIDVAESPLYELSMELKDKYSHISHKALIGDIRDIKQMRSIFETYHPDIIYHAAAYKHVPLMEEYPSEAILTNVLGSKNVMDMAIEYGAEAFIMISTDKAVNPSSVMGASKRIAEIYVQSLWQKLKNENQNCLRVVTTRFGNVLGSNGSVIPRFSKQIEEGGPVTVTHPEIIRYFMTIPEACRLVLEAGNLGKGGEVFLFDMGEPVKIRDMAERMIRLLGLEPQKDIEIVFSGLRPGEKLYEELLYDKEKTIPTHNQKIKIGSVRKYDYDKLSNDLELLIKIAESRQNEEVVKMMKMITPEFISQNSIYEKFDMKREKVSL